MGNKLYVGNLPFEITDEEIKSAFAPFGNVAEVNIIKDKFSGRSRGFAFVEMSSDEEAQKAVEGLNDTEMGGRKLVVNEARPPRERSGDGGGDRRY